MDSVGFIKFIIDLKIHKAQETRCCVVNEKFRKENILIDKGIMLIFFFNLTWKSKISIFSTLRDFHMLQTATHHGNYVKKM